MSQIHRFRQIVLDHTQGNSKKALPCGDFITLMGVKHPARRASVRAQVTRAMQAGGPLRDLVENGLVLADVANRQPACFDGIPQAKSTLPVVIDEGPISDLRTFPETNLTKGATDAKNAVVDSLSTVRMPVKAAEEIAGKVSRIVFEVEREKLRADRAANEAKIHAEHAAKIEKMYYALVQALPQKMAAE